MVKREHLAWVYRDYDKGTGEIKVKNIRSTLFDYRKFGKTRETLKRINKKLEGRISSLLEEEGLAGIKPRENYEYKKIGKKERLAKRWHFSIENFEAGRGSKLKLSKYWTGTVSFRRKYKGKIKRGFYIRTRKRNI